MSEPALERRVLLMAPTSRDAELTRSILTRAGIMSEHFADFESLCDALDDGAGAVLFPEEAVGQGSGRLAHYLAMQPPWSDIPLLVLARPGAVSADVAQAME